MMDADSPDGLAWRRNFQRMSFAFAACQAMVTTPIGFATSVLDPGCAQVCTGVLMLASMLSSLLIGAPVVSTLGAWRALLLAMTCSSSYAALFAFAAQVEPGSVEQWISYGTGSVLMGCGSGILWTAQGAFFSDTSALVAELEGQPPEKVTSSLSSQFAVTLLVLEITVKLSASVLQGTFLQWQLSCPLINLNTMFSIFATLAAAMIGAMGFLVSAPYKLQSARSGGSPNVSQKVKEAFQLWASPEIWFLSFTNLTFGFCAGYMNGFVNGSFAKPSPTFGARSIGALLAMTAFVASAASAAFGLLAQKAGKLCVIAIGAASFAAIPLAVLLFHPDEANGYWGVWLLTLYVLQGTGRAVYESTNKAVFADFFPGAKSTGAFANCMMQNSVAFFASFILQRALPPKQDGILAWIVLALAVLAVPGYLIARKINSRRLGSLNRVLLANAR
jgi:MFS family permease